MKQRSGAVTIVGGGKYREVRGDLPIILLSPVISLSYSTSACSSSSASASSSKHTAGLKGEN